MIKSTIYLNLLFLAQFPLQHIMSTRFVHRTNMRSWISEYTPFDKIDALGDYLNCVIERK